MRCSFLAGMLLLGLVPRSMAQTMLDLIPQDAVAAVVVRDIDGWIDKGTRFLNEAKIRTPFGPSTFFWLAKSYVGVHNGLNSKGSAGILLMGPQQHENALNPDLLVPVIPFTDADDMAANFGLGKGKLPLKSIERISKARFGQYASRTKDHLFLSSSDKTLRWIQQAKSVAAQMPPKQRQRLNDSDLLLHFRRQRWLAQFDATLRERLKSFEVDSDADEGTVALGQLIKSMLEIQHATVGIRLGDGVSVELFAPVPSTDEAATLLRQLRDKCPVSTLRGLPAGPVLLAQAASVNEHQPALLARGLSAFLLENFLEPEEVVAPMDRLRYVGVFYEIWTRLRGHRLALYQNAEPTKHGKVSAIAILDTDDGGQFVRDMKSLAKMAEAASLIAAKKEVADDATIALLVADLSSPVYRVRQAASTRLALIGEPALPALQKAIDSRTLKLEELRRTRTLRDAIAERAAADRKEAALDAKPLPLRPKLTFVPGEEKRKGRAIDVVHVKLRGRDNKLNDQYREWLGPEWDKIRIGVVGKQVVVLIGSDLELLDAALLNVAQGRAGLAESKSFADFRNRQVKDRVYELHVSTAAMLSALEQQPRREAPISYSSWTLTLEPAALQIRGWLPMSEVRAIARKVQP